MEPKYVEIATAIQGRGAAPKVKRWDAKTKTTSVWDSLHRVRSETVLSS
jgi:ribosomal protein L3